MDSATGTGTSFCDLTSECLDEAPPARSDRREDRLPWILLAVMNQWKEEKTIGFPSISDGAENISVKLMKILFYHVKYFL